MRIRLLGLALLAAISLSVVVTATAFAESEFLVNENLVREETPVNGEGEFRFVTKKVPLLNTVEVLCTIVLEGYILGANPQHILITHVLDLEHHESGTLEGINETTASCVNVKNCPTPLLWPDDLPWLALVELMTGGVFLLHLTEDFEEPNGLPGYHVECMGSIALTNLCTFLAGFNLTNGVTDVNSSLTVAEQEAEGEVGTCEVGEMFLATEPGFLINSQEGNLSVS